MLNYVKTHAQKGNLKSCIDVIDEFCAAHWMMNLGPEKAHILSEVFKKHQPKKVLEIGGYCGYSSLVFTYLTQGQIHTIEIAEKFANIARQVHEFAGVKDQNQISIGTVESLKK
jgi:catechol O-methyltransferase